MLLQSLRRQNEIDRQFAAVFVVAESERCCANQIPPRLVAAGQMILQAFSESGDDAGRIKWNLQNVDNPSVNESAQQQRRFFFHVALESLVRVAVEMSAAVQFFGKRFSLATLMRANILGGVILRLDFAVTPFAGRSVAVAIVAGFARLVRVAAHHRRDEFAQRR